MNEGLRLNNGEGLQDRGKPTVKLDQEQPIEVGKPNPAAHLAPQHNGETCASPARHPLFA
jgi:hypothetical protein